MSQRSRRQGQCLVMLGTDFHSMGGMASVINVYLRAGLLDRWQMVYLPTHRDGSQWLKLITAVGAWWQFLLLVLRGKAAGVHIHAAAGASFWRKTLIALPAFIFRLPVIFHIHDGEFANFYWRRCGRVAQYLIRQVLARSRFVIALSNSWVVELTEIAPKANVVSIPNPVEMPAQGKPIAPDSKVMTVLFLGRLSKEKGVFDLLKAFAAINAAVMPCRLILAGNGDFESVRRDIDNFDLNELVEIAGWVGPEKKLELLNAASVLVLPSYIEGLPMAILEGMAAGLAVISTRVGGIPEVLVDSVNGLLFSPGDVKELTVCLERLAADKEFAKSLGIAAKECIEKRFSVPVVINKIDSIYCAAGFELL